MSYSPLPSKNEGDQITHTDWNQIADNFEAGVPAIFTTKGDLAVGIGVDSASRQPVGTNGQLLTADSSQSTGMKWSTPGTSAKAKYKKTATQSVNNATYTIIDFDTIVFDPDTAVTTGGSWKYTVPTGKGGKYIVAVGLRLQSSSLWDTNETAQLWLYKNGIQDHIIGEKRMDAAGTYGVYINGLGMIDLAAGDYIDVRLYQTSGSAVTVDSDSLACHIAIARMFS